MNEDFGRPRPSTSKKYRARKRILKLFTRPQIDDLAKSLGNERPWNAERNWLEVRILESWSKVRAEIEELVDQVVEDSKDEQSDVQTG